MSDCGISYSDASNMDWEEILEANAALDIIIEQSEKPKKGGRK